VKSLRIRTAEGRGAGLNVISKEKKRGRIDQGGGSGRIPFIAQQRTATPVLFRTMLEKGGGERTYYLQIQGKGEGVSGKRRGGSRIHGKRHGRCGVDGAHLI